MNDEAADIEIPLLPCFEFDAESINQTREDWLSQIHSDPNIYGSTYFSFLDWVVARVEHPEYEQSDYYFYGLHFQDSPEKASVILEVSHARPNSNAPWLKILRIRTEPVLSPDATDYDDKKNIAAIGSAFVRGMHLAHHDAHPTEKVKFHAENEQMLSLFRLMAGSREFQELPFSMRVYRKWLEISWEQT